MRRIILFLLLIPLVTHADIYKWEDGQGNVHYTDQPHRGAEEVKLPPIPTYEPSAKETAKKAGDEEVEEHEYEAIEIAQPADQATIRNNYGHVAVSLGLKPALVSGDKVSILVDGKTVGEPVAATSFTLQNIERGSHTIDAEIIDANNNVIGKVADPVTFFMHRPRTNMIAPAPKPKPLKPAK